MKYSKLLLCSAALSATLSSAALAEPMAMVSGVAGTQPVAIGIVLPLRDRAGLEALVDRQHDPASASFHQWLTPAQVDDRFGPTQAVVDKAVAALRARGMSVTRIGRLLHASGTATQVDALLGTTLATGRTASGHLHMFAVSTPTLPAEIAAVGGVVVGLGRNPHEAHTFSRRVNVPSSVLAAPQNRTSTTGGYWYDDLKQAYQYPSYQTMITKNGKQVRLDGTGTTIGILMSADVLDSDINAVFSHENFVKNSGQVRNPTLYKRVLVNGGSSTSSGAFDEASLDVQEALTGAPGSHVILYELPSLSDSDIEAGYFKIVTDNQADIVSSSFGECELVYTPAYNGGSDFTQQLDIEHQLFLQGNAQGITFLASSGDNAGLECPSVAYATGSGNGTFQKGVSVPAADPNVTAVGGTNVVTAATTGSLASTYVKENAYSDPLLPNDPYGNGYLASGGYWGAGGGLSTIYRKPAYQSVGSLNTGSSGYRALPDIGMQVGGCPGGESKTPCNGGDSPLNGNGNTDRSYVVISVDGEFAGLIGTSVASPEFSAVTALLVEQYGRMGNLNTYIYDTAKTQAASGSNSLARSTTAFHRSIPGYNGVVTNNQPVNVRNNSFNYTVGVGTPVVYRFVGAAGAQPAGVPQSKSNP